MSGRPHHSERKRVNAQFRDRATRHREPWLASDDEFLEAMWDSDHSEEELREIARTLGRTVEACRQRYYELKWGVVEGVLPEPEENPKPRPAWMDDEGLPEWYVA